MHSKKKEEKKTCDTQQDNSIFKTDISDGALSLIVFSLFLLFLFGIFLNFLTSLLHHWNSFSSFLVLQIGYRHIDCAQIYGNEKEVVKMNNAEHSLNITPSQPKGFTALVHRITPPWAITNQNNVVLTTVHLPKRRPFG